jgi:hypothetical protein
VAISKRLRFEILTRDSHRCIYCGRAAPEVKLTVDHVLPEALGGRTEASNLVTACADCNAGKTSVGPAREIVAAVAEDALRWSRAIRMAAEKRARDHAFVDQVLKAFEDQWADFSYNAEERVVVKKPIPRDDDWRESIERLIELGLPPEQIERLVRIAMSNEKIQVHDIWRYFMGCCWNVLREIQGEAAAIMKTETDHEPTARELLNQLP